MAFSKSFSDVVVPILSESEFQYLYKLYTKSSKDFNYVIFYITSTKSFQFPPFLK